MKLQDCFIGQKVGLNSKSMGVIVGAVEDLFETQDINSDEVVRYALVNTKQLDYNLEIKVSKLLGVL